MGEFISFLFHFFRGWRRTIGLFALIVATMLAEFYLLQIVFRDGSGFTSDEAERLRIEADIRFENNAELTTIGLLVLLAAYLFLSSLRDPNTTISDLLRKLICWLRVSP